MGPECQGPLPTISSQIPSRSEGAAPPGSLRSTPEDSLPKTPPWQHRTLRASQPARRGSRKWGCTPDGPGTCDASTLQLLLDLHQGAIPAMYFDRGESFAVDSGCACRLRRASVAGCGPCRWGFRHHPMPSSGPTRDNTAKAGPLPSIRLSLSIDRTCASRTPPLHRGAPGSLRFFGCGLLPSPRNGRLGRGKLASWLEPTARLSRDFRQGTHPRKSDTVCTAAFRPLCVRTHHLVRLARARRRPLREDRLGGVQ